MPPKTKGFRFSDQRTIDMRFDEDHRLHGLEITIKRQVPVGLVLAAQRGAIAEITQFLADSITEWNVEDADGRRVEPSAEAIGKYAGQDDLIEMVRAWQEAMAAPGGPLAGLSRNGVS